MTLRVVNRSPSHILLLDLLRDHKWHSLPQCVIYGRSYRMSSMVYRLRKLGFVIEWQNCEKGTEYRLVE